MQSFNLDQTITAWSSIAENVFVPHTEQEYDHLVEMLDILTEVVASPPSHDRLVQHGVNKPPIPNQQNSYAIFLLNA